MSLFSHAIGEGGIRGGKRGLVTGASRGGRVPCSTRGGEPVDVEPATGRMVESTYGGLSPTIGGMGSGSSKIAKAEHLIVGFPVVPGGQVQMGRCLVV